MRNAFSDDLPRRPGQANFRPLIAALGLKFGLLNLISDRGSGGTQVFGHKIQNRFEPQCVHEREEADEP